MKQINLICEKPEFLVWNIKFNTEIKKQHREHCEKQVIDTEHQNIKMPKNSQNKEIIRVKLTGFFLWNLVTKF